MISYKPMSDKPSVRSPWFWVPSLYFAQGIPYVAVMIVSVLMYKRLGVSNTDIALYTSWLNLPWVIKPFWSPFVDLLKTKRWWVATMQLLIGAGLAGVAFTIPTTFFFQASLAVFWLLAFSSATHDIAADGFYMLALDSHEQAFFVGTGVLFTDCDYCRTGCAGHVCRISGKQYGEYPACLVCYILYFRRAVFACSCITGIYFLCRKGISHRLR